MKIFRTLLTFSLLLAMLVSCGNDTPHESTADSLNAPPTTATEEKTTTEADTEETTLPANPDASSFYELTYMSEIREPIYAGYCVEDLQWRIGDGTKREFTIISRVYNGTGAPLVVSGASMSLKTGNVSSQNIISKITPAQQHYFPFQRVKRRALIVSFASFLADARKEGTTRFHSPKSI